MIEKKLRLFLAMKIRCALQLSKYGIYYDNYDYMHGIHHKGL